MKKLKMVVTSVIVLAIVGSAFAFNAKKKTIFCTSGDLTSTTCSTILGDLITQKRIAGTATTYYVVDWDGVACDANNTHVCTTSAKFAND